MHAIHAPVPIGALTRIRRQALVVTDFQSCQQTFEFHALSFGALTTWLATPGNDCLIEISDNHQILPYTSLQMPVGVTPVLPSTWEPWEAGLYLTSDQISAELGATVLVTQINAFFRAMVGRGFRAFKSAKAQRVGEYVQIYLPWGMIGTGAGSGDGPQGPEQVRDILPGVDNPLWFGIIGPKRHAFRVQPRYPGPYYGPPPIG